MSYNTIVAMAASQSLMARTAACAAQEGNTNPRNWASSNLLALVATAPTALTDAWEAAAADVSANPDTGKRADVITDAMIQSAVEARKALQAGDPTQGWPTA